MVSAELPAPQAISSEPDVAVAVLAVTHNSSKHIAAFLAALPRALEGVDSARVVIVDNASTDGTVEFVRGNARWVDLVEAGDNAGYAAGINVGLRLGTGRLGTYILNPDAIPAPGSIVRLVEALRDHPNVGLAVPRVLDIRGQLKYSLRREPTLGRAFGEAVLGGHRAARFPILGDMIRDPEHYRDGATADWATGAAMFFSRRAIEGIGPWDERFFLYSEETDYALRLRDAGFQLRYVEDATVIHPGGAMSASPYLWSLVARNRTVLYRKRHKRIASAAYWAIVVLNEGSRAIVGPDTHRAALRALFRIRPEIRT